MRTLFAILMLVYGCGPGDDPDRTPETSRAAVWRGHLTFSGEAGLLRTCGEQRELRVVDRTGGALRKAHENLAAGPEESVYLQVQGGLRSSPEDGSGQSDSSILIVEELLRAAHEGHGCEEDLTGFEFQARGNEPFWRLTIAESGIVLHRMGAPEPTTFPSRKPEDGLYVTATEDPPREIRIEIKEERCVDGMSGEWFSHRATIDFEGDKLTGCAYAGVPPPVGLPASESASSNPD